MNKVGTQNEANRIQWVRNSLAAVPAGWRILDAGAGQLRYKPFCDHLRYVSQDFCQYDGKGDGAGMQTKEWDQRGIDLVCDITRIPEPDASFDAIMCIEVLEHVPDPVAALRELSRLIRAGGRLILTAPFCSLTHYAPYHFSTGFSRYFYEQWLPEFGFEITEISFNGNYFEYLAQEVRRIPFVRNKYATGASAGRIHWCIEAAAIRFMLWWLDRLNRHDAGSHEVLAYGLHVQAVQRG